MRSFLTLIGCLPLALTAQHCDYDFASIIVVRPHLEGDTNVVEGLHITLLDSTNLPELHYGNSANLFRPNSDYEACAPWQGAFMQGHQVCYPFAKNNYVLVIGTGHGTSKMKLLIQDERPRSHIDIRRRKWPDRFKTQVIPLTEFDSYSLCGVYDNTVYPKQHDRPDFHPVDVILKLQ